MEWRGTLGNEQPALVPHFICRSLGRPFSLLEEPQSICETISWTGPYLSIGTGFQIEHDGNQSLQRIECHRDHLRSMRL